jgi:murein L,D-transpeptidase YafK
MRSVFRLLALGVFLVGIPAAADQAPPLATCPAGATIVLVDTLAHRMILCEQGKPHAVFRVALGQGGTGKQEEGDARTPLGRYSLGAPRRSSRYRMSMPVGYPTEAQRKAGLTGSNVVVHGPPVGYDDVVGATARDWTLGCVALSAPDLAATVAWVNAHRVRTIELR